MEKRGMNGDCGGDGILFDGIACECVRSEFLKFLIYCVPKKKKNDVDYYY